MDPVMASEDFSFFARRLPSTFVFMGTGDEALGTTAHLHTPRFRLDERVLPRGAALHAAWAMRYLEKREQGFTEGRAGTPTEHEEL